MTISEALQILYSEAWRKRLEEGWDADFYDRKIQSSSIVFISVQVAFINVESLSLDLFNL